MKKLPIVILVFFQFAGSILAQGIWGPKAIPSFGPNGTHWPSNIPTPFPYDAASTDFFSINVSCSWNAIASAVSSLTNAQIEQGVIIYVEPGVLTGNGSGSTSKAVLKELGSTDWKKRITIVPKKGYGSISVTGGCRFSRLYGINIAGFKYDSLCVSGSSNSAISWSFVEYRASFTGDPSFPTDLVEIVEVVFGNDVALDAADRVVVTTVGMDLSRVIFDGCYFAPKRRPAGSSSHTDTLQYSNTVGGSCLDMYIKNSALFASDNTAVQTGGVIGLSFEHTFLCAGAVSRTRYPYLSGGDQANANYVLNGGGENLRAYRSVFVGGESIQSTKVPKSWSEAIDTRIPEGFSVNGGSPISGSFTVDTTLYSTDLSDQTPTISRTAMLLANTLYNLPAPTLGTYVPKVQETECIESWAPKKPFVNAIQVRID